MACYGVAYTFMFISVYINRRYLCDVLKYNSIDRYIGGYHGSWHSVVSVVVSRLRVVGSKAWLFDFYFVFSKGSDQHWAQSSLLVHGY
jgi:hypothetical protein